MTRRIPVRKPDRLPATPGATLALPEQGARYARDVLRLPEGELVELFDGEGVCVIARLTEITADHVIATIKEVLPERAGESSLELILYQAIPKGDRFEWLLEKCTELGVTQICPIETARTVVKIKPNKSAAKLERWEKIVASAARQTRRALVPTIKPARDFLTALKEIEERESLGDDASIDLVASPSLDASTPTLGFGESLAGKKNLSSVAIWIGPEGGFTQEEVEALQRAGAKAVSMGPRILRAETAAVTAIALAQHLAGDLP
jgi:16S rRNA (uracil1498-N3)-methyltransferase